MIWLIECTFLNVQNTRIVRSLQQRWVIWWLSNIEKSKLFTCEDNFLNNHDDNNTHTKKRITFEFFVTPTKISKLAYKAINTIYDNDRIRYDAIRYDTIRYDTIRYVTIRYDTIRYDTIRYYTIRYDTIRYDTLRYDTIRYDTFTIRYDTIRYDMIWYDTIWYDTIRCDFNAMRFSIEPATFDTYLLTYLLT